MEDGCAEEGVELVLADEGVAEDQMEVGAVEGRAADDDDEETRRPRICRRPLAPTKEMVEEHNRTHAE